MHIPGFSDMKSFVHDGLTSPGDMFHDTLKSLKFAFDPVAVVKDTVKNTKAFVHGVGDGKHGNATAALGNLTLDAWAGFGQARVVCECVAAPEAIPFILAAHAAFSVGIGNTIQASKRLGTAGYNAVSGQKQTYPKQEQTHRSHLRRSRRTEANAYNQSQHKHSLPFLSS